MSNSVLQLCVLAVVCGAIMSITPEGGAKKISHLLSTVILLTAIVAFVGNLDFQEYVQQAASMDEIEKKFAKDFAESEKELKHLIIESRYKEYILDKAEENGSRIYTIDFELRNTENSVFYPYSVEIIGVWEPSQKKELTVVISSELGIPSERQHWTYDEQ